MERIDLIRLLLLLLLPRVSDGKLHGLRLAERISMYETF
jgi:hypothetical protein